MFSWCSTYEPVERNFVHMCTLYVQLNDNKIATYLLPTYLNKRITAFKPTTCLLDPVPTKLLKELLPVAEEPLLNIINSSLSLGHVPKPFKLEVIKPLIKKPKLDPCELANYRPISNLPFVNFFEKVVSAQLHSIINDLLMFPLLSFPICVIPLSFAS